MEDQKDSVELEKCFNTRSNVVLLKNLKCYLIVLLTAKIKDSREIFEVEQNIQHFTKYPITKNLYKMGLK
jgi:hypothetical protein